MMASVVAKPSTTPVEVTGKKASADGEEVVLEGLKKAYSDLKTKKEMEGVFKW